MEESADDILKAFETQRHSISNELKTNTYIFLTQGICNIIHDDILCMSRSCCRKRYSKSIICIHCRKMNILSKDTTDFFTIEAGLHQGESFVIEKVPSTTEKPIIHIEKEWVQLLYFPFTIIISCYIQELLGETFPHEFLHAYVCSNEGILVKKSFPISSHSTISVGKSILHFLTNLAKLLKHDFVHYDIDENTLFIDSRPNYISIGIRNLHKSAITCPTNSVKLRISGDRLWKTARSNELLTDIQYGPLFQRHFLDDQLHPTVSSVYTIYRLLICLLLQGNWYMHFQKRYEEDLNLLFPTNTRIAMTTFLHQLEPLKKNTINDVMAVSPLSVSAMKNFMKKYS